MRLAVDADILVGQLTNYRGQVLIAHADLELYITDLAWRETQHELPKRTEAMVRRGTRTPEEASSLLASAWETAVHALTVLGSEHYAHEEAQARACIADERDWPTVALALTLDAGIWTNDRHFFGCGCPTWRTETLRAVLALRAARPGG